MPARSVMFDRFSEATHVVNLNWKPTGQSVSHYKFTTYACHKIAKSTSQQHFKPPKNQHLPASFCKPAKTRGRPTNKLTSQQHLNNISNHLNANIFPHPFVNQRKRVGGQKTTSQQHLNNISSHPKVNIFPHPLVNQRKRVGGPPKNQHLHRYVNHAKCSGGPSKS